MKSKGKLATIYMYCKHGSIHIAVCRRRRHRCCRFFRISSDLICRIVRADLNGKYTLDLRQIFNAQMHVPICIIFCYFFRLFVLF